MRKGSTTLDGKTALQSPCAMPDDYKKVMAVNTKRWNREDRLKEARKFLRELSRER